MSNIKTDFTELDKYEVPRRKRHGSLPRLKNEETDTQYPNSELVKGDCPNDDCGYHGTALKSYGWNSYFSCPKCEQYVIVVG